MKYKSFSIIDDHHINRFLEEYGHQIASNSISYEKGMICFIYSDKSREEIEKQRLLESCSAFINQRMAELMGADVDEKFWRGQALRDNVKKDKIFEAVERKTNLAAQIRYVREIISEIEAGTYQGLKNGKGLGANKEGERQKGGETKGA